MDYWVSQIFGRKSLGKILLLLLKYEDLQSLPKLL